MIPLLTIKNLTLKIRHSEINLVQNINLSLFKNQITALIGASGSGKTLIARSIMGLLPPNIVVSQGQILYNQHDILQLNENQKNTLRGNKIAMIFQDPSSHLNPTMPIGKQIAEGLIYKQHLTKKRAKDKVFELLEITQIANPSHRYKHYPHQFSGGEKQRIMIAMALAMDPDVLIADEPTTALDSITQKKLLILLQSLQKQMGLSILFITHDLKIIKSFAANGFVLHEGSIIEQGNIQDLFTKPTTLLTKQLLKSAFFKITPKDYNQKEHLTHAID